MLLINCWFSFASLRETEYSILSESGFLGLWDFRDVVDIFFVWCLGVVICQNQDIWLLSEVEVQDLRIYRMLFESFMF